MASKKPSDGGTLNRLAGRGEEAVTRLVEELSKNPRVTDALGRVMEAKTKIDHGARGAVAQAGLAAADELKELRKQIERLERRLAKLESGESKPAAKKTATAKKSETKKTPTTKKSTTTKKAADKAPSPAPGRSIGGGPGRGSSAS
jgi:polyhydroxyalkanoate synthesis regulator phasin